MLRLVTALLLLAAALTTAWAAEPVVVEDWTKVPLGTRGIPPGWKGQSWGSPAYDFVTVDNGGRRVLHMRSQNEGSTISTEIRGRVRVKETPILVWSWKALSLPPNGNSCRKSTDDQAAQIYVAWPRFPEAVRSRIIGYVWDTTQPVGTVCRSEKTGTVTYVVVRSGPADLGKWITEQRNVREDFLKIYGEEPDDPAAVSVSIDTNDTRSTAETLFGPIAFRQAG